MFAYRMTLNRVHDVVEVTENGEKLKLRVDADAMRIVAGLQAVQKDMGRYGELGEEDRVEVARRFAAVIFGDEQAEKLMAFYRNDAGCVVSICGKYFAQRLNKKITRAQKRGAK